MDNIGVYEGSVAPAFMKRQNQGKAADAMSKLPLRVGRVIRVHSPGDPSNRSTRFFEYDVLVEEGSEHAAATRTVIPHCWMVSQFGGAADFTRSTPRILDTDRQNVADFGTGSLVLVLMINASSFAGVIIGGIQHAKAEVDDSGQGHRSIWQFNGIRQEVDSSGQLRITRKGPTDAAGNVGITDALSAGAAFELLKDGGSKLSTGNDTQHVFIDFAQKKVDISADLGGISMNTPGLITTSSIGVHIGAATSQMLLGTPYRIAETTLHATEIAGWTAVAAAFGAEAATWGIFAPFAIALDPTGTLTTAALTAAAAATAAAGAAGAAAAALGAFEGGAAGYLSIKNLLD